MELIYLFVSFIASVAGSICGIGGGIVIKPVLDAFGTLEVSAISFLSGCTVLTMSAYSVVKARISKDTAIDFSVSSYLGIGAVAGGIAGKGLFQYLRSVVSPAGLLSAGQSVILFFITLAALVYTLRQEKIWTLRVKNRICCMLIGLGLGFLSSFLGIGGGPVNLVILYYFFSMGPKTAAQNSIYIICLSQISSLLLNLSTGTIPPVPVFLLAGMGICGILGAALGRRINRRLKDRHVSRLFLCLMVVILGICLYNIAGSQTGLY